MDSRQFHRRVWGVVLALALVLLWLGSALYDVQVVQGPSLAARANHKIQETETVEAARGQILDRYGRVLVSNRVVYQVTLDFDAMGKEKTDRLEVIERLMALAQVEGVEWTDSLLPITQGRPFRFTTDTPYYEVSEDEDGNLTVTLSRLARLAIKLKCLPDTEYVDYTYNANKDKTSAVLTPAGEEAWRTKKLDPKKDGPTAAEILASLCESFGLEELLQEDPHQARILAGVLYELYLRQRDIYWETYVFAEDVNIDFISKVKEHSLAGVVVEPTTVREYNTEYAAHLLGRVAAMSAAEWEYYKEQGGYEMDDKVGKEGIERAFESDLRGKPGVRIVERNNAGKVVNQTWKTEPEAGSNVVLTIDIVLQQAVEDILASSLENLKSEEVEGAACVIVDVHNGEILAAASYPTFSLPNYARDIQANSENPLKPFLNRAFQGTYPPGSTFKMITSIAALEEGIITPKTIINATGTYTYYDSPQPMCWIRRQYGGQHGRINVTKAIEVSCNYFMYEIGRLLGIDRLGAYAAKFGLGEKSGVELPESKGVMAGPAFTESLGGKWQEGAVLSVAIGQESTQASPLQLANYIATLVNGGNRYSAHLLKQVKSNDFSQILYTYEPEIVETIDIKPENLEAVKAGMLSLTQTGSVSMYFRDLGIQVGAKTGSAQVSAETESNAVFVCFAPYDDPQIAVAIAVEHGGSGSDLGRMAAEILEYYFSVQENQQEIVAENTLVR